MYKQDRKNFVQLVEHPEKLDLKFSEVFTNETMTSEAEFCEGACDWPVELLPQEFSALKTVKE